MLHPNSCHVWTSCSRSHFWISTRSSPNFLPWNNSNSSNKTVNSQPWNLAYEYPSIQLHNSYSTPPPPPHIVCAHAHKPQQQKTHPNTVTSQSQPKINRRPRLWLWENKNNLLRHTNITSDNKPSIQGIHFHHQCRAPPWRHKLQKNLVTNVKLCMCIYICV